MKKTKKYALLIAALVTVGLTLARCTKIEEDVRVERIPLPQGEIDPPDPAWDDPSDIDGKHTKPQ